MITCKYMLQDNYSSPPRLKQCWNVTTNSSQYCPQHRTYILSLPVKLLPSVTATHDLVARNMVNIIKSVQKLIIVLYKNVYSSKSGDFVEQRQALNSALNRFVTKANEIVQHFWKEESDYKTCIDNLLEKYNECNTSSKLCLDKSRNRLKAISKLGKMNNSSDKKQIEELYSNLDIYFDLIGSIQSEIDKNKKRSNPSLCKDEFAHCKEKIHSQIQEENTAFIQMVKKTIRKYNNELELLTNALSAGKALGTFMTNSSNFLNSINNIPVESYKSRSNTLSIELE